MLQPGSIPDPVLRAMALPYATIAERMANVSQPLLGQPYVLDPLGEGQGHDPDPLARYDAFDCQTFVEEVLALALAADPTDAGRIRTSLRYGDSPIDYPHRRHFMELQWLPGNLAAGWLRVTTSEYGAPRHLHQTVTDATWSAWRDRPRFNMPDEALPSGDMDLDILPLDKAIAVAPGIRPGSIVMIAREPRPGIPIFVTHLGVVVSPGQLRHASTTSNKVRDQDLASYLRQAQGWKGWPVAGIAVVEPVDPRL